MRPAVLLACAALAACTGSRTARAPAAAAGAPAIANTPGPEPSPADNGTCSDPIAGTWRARVFRPEVGRLDEVTLALVRVGATELRGQILVATWAANHRDAEPPACPDGSPAVSRVVQMASGWLHGTEVDIRGSDPSRTALPCGVEMAAIYNPDHFTGELDDTGDDGPRLATTNDDGGIDQGRPHLFTRISCQAAP